MRNNFENQVISRLDRESKDEFIEQAYQKALGVLDKNRMNPDDFTDLYTPKGVEEDNAKVAELEARFRQDPDYQEQSKYRKLATILEALLMEQIELSDWFGPDAETFTTTKYDDYINKVDCVVEFQEGPNSARHLGMALDVTFSSNLEKKIEQIKEEIDRSKLTEVKYFYSEHLDFRGRLEKVPRVIIGAEYDSVIELTRLWLANKRKELGKHPAQLLFLKEIQYQLEVFRDYALANGKDEVAGKMERRLSIIDPILREKETQVPVGNMKNDKVFSTIIKATSRMGMTKAAGSN